MGKMNVAQFAGELGLPVELLLEQLKSAGVSKQKDTDTISEQDKSQLLEHLRGAHGAGKNKITLVRRETTAIKKADRSGKSRTIQVEVRKKRTVAPVAAAAVEVPEAATAAEEAKPKKTTKKVLDEQELKAREEEARLQAELASRQAAEIQAKQVRSKRKATAAEPAPAPAPEPVVEEKPVVDAPSLLLQLRLRRKELCINRRSNLATRSRVLPRRRKSRQPRIVLGMKPDTRNVLLRAARIPAPDWGDAPAAVQSARRVTTNTANRKRHMHSRCRPSLSCRK